MRSLSVMSFTVTNVVNCKQWWICCFSTPPLNPKLVYVYLIASIGCGVLLSAGFKRKAACLIYAGQMMYFAVNFYTNPKWDYPQWQRISTCAVPTLSGIAYNSYTKPKWDYPQLQGVSTGSIPIQNGTSYSTHSIPAPNRTTYSGRMEVLSLYKAIHWR